MPAELTLFSSVVTLREAEHGEVLVIVELLAADQLGALRDGVIDSFDLEPYEKAFAMLAGDPLTFRL